MSKKLLFWVLMIIWLFCILYLGWAAGYKVFGPGLLPWCVAAVLGWQTFGRPID